MLNDFGHRSILNRLFDVNGNEWPKISVSWVMRFFHRISFVIVWTVLLAMFVSRFGIASLPYLFVLVAVFTVIGSLLFSTFVRRISREMMLILNIFGGGGLLFAAIWLVESNPVLFFAFLIVVVAVFMMQFLIALNGYVEGMFSSMQSERTFPLIESAETIGGILAGLAVTLLAESMPSYELLYIAIAALFVIVPLVLFPGSVEIESSDVESGLRLDRKIFTAKQKVFMKGLLLIVFFQWLLFNLIEFQYTKAVYHDVSYVVLEAGSGFEHTFVHELGILFALFSATTLVFQLFVAGRLIKNLGVIGSMLLHPIVTLLSLFGMTLSFTFLTAVLTRNNFGITSAIHKNAYHSVYYSLHERLRVFAREFLEGVVRPVGAMIGTLLLILLQRFLLDDQLIFGVNVLMILSAVGIFYVTWQQQRKYTDLALDDLLNSKSDEIRLNALDILTQKGHRYLLPSFSKILVDEGELLQLRVKMLRVYCELYLKEGVDDIIFCFNSKHFAVRSAAVSELLASSDLPKRAGEDLLLKFKLIDALRHLYKREKDEELLIDVIHLLSRLSDVSTVEFLVDVLKKSKGVRKVEAITALGNCGEESLLKFVEPYLKSKSFEEQIRAAIGFARFPLTRRRGEQVIAEYFASKNPTKLALGIFAAGELKLKSQHKLLVKYLYSQKIPLRIHAAVALAKMGDRQGIAGVAALLLSGDNRIVSQVRRLIRNLDVRILKNIDKIVEHVVNCLKNNKILWSQH